MAHLVLLSKFIFAIILVLILFQYNILSIREMNVLLTQPQVWFAASILVILALLIGVMRWKLLLLGAGVILPYRKLLQIYCISAFIGTFLPGAVGQDVFRTVALMRQPFTGKTGVAVSVIFDRAIGLFGFLSVSVLFIWIKQDLMLSSTITTALATGVILSFLFILLGSTVFFAIAGPLSKSSFLQGSKSPWFIRQKILHILDIIIGFKGHMRTLLLAYLLSLLIPILLAGCLVLFVMLKNDNSLGVLELMLSGFIANIANTIPLTPGGLGIGESAFDQMCKLLEHVPSGQAYGNVFLAFRTTTLIVNLVFGIYFFVYSRIFDTQI